MIVCKENESVEDAHEEEYDYMNEEPLEDETEYEYDEEENDYCD